MKNKDFLKLLFVGDIFPADLDFNIGFGIKSLFDQHQGNLWKPVLSALFKNADLVIGNLESPLIPEAIKAKGSFYGSPVFASFLKESGVTTLNIANNHILEQDDKGFESTLKELHQNQIDVIGSIENNQQKIVYKNMEGIKIAIAGFCNVDVLPDYHHKYFAVLNGRKCIQCFTRNEI
jgi:poly-gamma-glutamate synthesis protein (capsule biosynthesis protein)